MAQNNYELTQSTILEMENEVLRAQITDLKADIKKLEIEAQNKTILIEKYKSIVDDIIKDLDNIIKI